MAEERGSRSAGTREGVELRAMRREHLEAVVEIERASYPTPWSRSAFLGEIRAGTVSHALVAVDTTGPEEEVIGYLCCWIVRDLMQVNNIAVRADRRGDGLGERLLRTALEEGRRRGAEACYLDVRASNAPAQGLYRKLGFHEVGVRPGYYADTKEDALVMRLELLEPSGAPDGEK